MADPVAQPKAVVRDAGKPAPIGDDTVEQPGTGIRVLIVDDERDALMMLGVLLRSAGFGVELVQRGEELPAVVAAYKPHAVVLDIQLPGRNGFQLANELRGAHGKSCPALVAITGMQSALRPTEGKVGPFDYYFLKPCNPTLLMRVLASLGARALR